MTENPPSPEEQEYGREKKAQLENFISIATILLKDNDISGMTTAEYLSEEFVQLPSSDQYILFSYAVLEIIRLRVQLGRI